MRSAVNIHTSVQVYTADIFFIQMVCTKQGGGSERVIGLHLTGPNAGEILQGFAVAME